MAASGMREQCEVNSDRNIIEFSWHFNKILICRSMIVNFSHFPFFPLDIHVIHENINVQTTSPTKKHGCVHSFTYYLRPLIVKSRVVMI